MKWNCLNFLKKELLFFWFLKGTEMILEFIYIYTEMEMYFHLGEMYFIWVCNSAFIIIISGKCHNMWITYNTGLELILFLFLHTAHDYQAVNCAHWKNECKNTNKTRFSRGLRECYLHVDFPNALFPLSLWPIWKQRLHFSINVFYQNPPNPNSNLVVHLISVPPSPAALLPEKTVLTTGFWSQEIDFSLQRPPELKLAVSMQS